MRHFYTGQIVKLIGLAKVIKGTGRTCTADHGHRSGADVVHEALTALLELLGWKSGLVMHPAIEGSNVGWRGRFRRKLLRFGVRGMTIGNGTFQSAVQLRP